MGGASFLHFSTCKFNSEYEIFYENILNVNVFFILFSIEILFCVLNLNCVVPFLLWFLNKMTYDFYKLIKQRGTVVVRLLTLQVLYV